MGHKNVVAVNVLSGKFANSTSLTPDTSRSTLAVLETIVLADGTLSLALLPQRRIAYADGRGLLLSPGSRYRRPAGLYPFHAADPPDPLQ